jgi:hypothetical protein
MEIMKNHRSFTIKPLTEKAGDVFKEGIRQLDMPYWVSAGTALGLYREGDFIEGDTDLDIEMLYREGIEEEILNKLDFDLIRTYHYDNKVQQMAFIKDETIFDIYFYEIEGDEAVNRNELGVMRLPTKFLNTENIKTKYGNLPFPSPIEEYLQYRYGDWKTPSKKKGLYGNDF